MDTDAFCKQSEEMRAVFPEAVPLLDHALFKLVSGKTAQGSGMLTLADMDKLFDQMREAQSDPWMFEMSPLMYERVRSMPKWWHPPRKLRKVHLRKIYQRRKEWRKKYES